MTIFILLAHPKYLASTEPCPNLRGTRIPGPFGASFTRVIHAQTKLLLRSRHGPALVFWFSLRESAPKITLLLSLELQVQGNL